MNITESIAYINDPSRYGSRFGLESIGRLLKYMDDPQEKLQFIHVAGTNGKGSTCAFMHGILKAAGYRVGLFTSPYIRRFHDRIQVNGEDIGDEDIIRLTEKIKDISEQIEKSGELPPTTFEMVTAMAFQYFYEQQVEVVVLEVGLGGALDCTNIIPPPMAAVITPLGMDHCEVLGHSIEEIAKNKAGIIKPGTLAFTAKQTEEAMDTIRVHCEELAVPLYEVDDTAIINIHADEMGSTFQWRSIRGAQYDLSIGLVGKYQVNNTILALTVLERLDAENRLTITERAVKEGLKATHWPGRLEVMSKSPLVVLDGSHNPQGVANLVENIHVFHYDKLFLILGILADKDVDAMIKDMASIADEVIVTDVPVPRGMKAEALAKHWAPYGEAKVIASYREALAMALCQAKEDDLVLAAGSLYLISAIRDYYLKNY